VSDAEICPSPLRRRLENDPWASALGIEFLDVRRGHCRVGLQLRSHMLNFQGYPHAVASAHAVAHRLTS
jgi:acyl-coenzyme A thioesterase PaaI-like protein